MICRIALNTCLVALLAVAAPADAAAPTTKLGTASTDAGKLITGTNSRTLYFLISDKSAKSGCYGQCAVIWPPVLAARKPAAGPGVKSSLIGLSRRRDGKRQVTYKGHPLYYYSRDTRRGQIEGAGLTDYFGSWRAISPAGAAVRK